MREIISILSIFFFCGIFCLVGCVDKNTNIKEKTKQNEIIQNNYKGKDDMKNDVDLLCDKLKISEERAKGAIEILMQSGVSSQIKKVKLIDNKQGIEAIVTDKNGNKFYLSFDEMGFLELARKDSAHGEILFGIVQ